jgi:hypothetical protein
MMTEHLEESTLALFALHAPEVNGRRTEIESHLADCAGCRALFEEINGYYDEVGQSGNNDVPDMHPVLQPTGRIARTLGDDRPAPIVPIRRPMHQVVVGSFRTYPVRWTGGVALVAAALMLVVPKLVTRDVNPAYLRAKDEFLIGLNKTGEELWRKRVVPGFDLKTSKAALENISILQDVDGDGKKEAFMLEPHPQVSPEGYSAIAIQCYNANGSERWRTEVQPTIQFDSVTFSGNFLTDPPFVVRDFERNGKFSVVSIAHHGTWWPTVISMLDANDGTSKARYWHPGWLKLAVKDFDGDGREEILAVGYSNAFKKNVVAVLDPRKVAGHAPATKEFTPNGVAEAAEKYYVLLPDPDLFGLSPRIPGEKNSEIEAGSGLVIRTMRYPTVGKQGDRVAEVFFEFDAQMNCLRVRGGDEFVALHRELEKEGKSQQTIGAEYFERLRNQVQYWDGEKFVKETTMNGKYVSSK